MWQGPPRSAAFFFVLGAAAKDLTVQVAALRCSSPSTL
jgi:hypothetical protein